MARIAGPAVRSYATEVELLADTPPNARLAYGVDVADLFVREASDWKRALVADRGGRTLAQIITAVGSSRRTVFIDRPIASSATVGTVTVTVPANLQLWFIGDGRLDIAANHTVVFQRAFAADRMKVLNYADGTSAVRFDMAGRGGVLLPEWWGALGDRSTDDYTPLSRMFAVFSDYIYGSPTSIGGQHEYWFAAGRTYITSAQLVLASASGFASSHVVRGNGAYLLGGNAIPRGTLKLGNDPSQKQFHGKILGLNVGSTTVHADAAALEISRADFAQMEGCEFSGGSYGVHATGEGGNGVHFDKCSAVGFANTGVHLGPDCLNFNVWTWKGGRIQQGPIGMHIGGVGAHVEAVDFSLCTTSAIKAENLGESKLHFYSEGIGPLTDANTAKVLHMIGCNKVAVEQSRINAAGSGGSSTNNAGYGVYLDDCADIKISGNNFLYAQRADVYIAANCDGDSIVIDETNRLEHSGNDMVSVNAGKLLRVADLTGKVRNRLSTFQLPRNSFYGPTEGTPRNLISNPNDFNAAPWTLVAGAVVSGVTVAPDGVSEAQVLDFPNTPYVGNGSTSRVQLNTLDTGEALDGKTLVMRYWYKPVAVVAPSIYDTHRLTAFVQRAAGDQDNAGLSGCFDGNDAWQFVEQRYTLPTVALNPQTILRFGFSSSIYAGDAVRAAIWGVQLFVAADADDLARHVPIVLGDGIESVVNDTLVDGSPAALFDVPLPNGGLVGGSLEYTIKCTDGTDHQVVSGQVTFNAVNKGGVYSTQVESTENLEAASAGTLSATWDIAEGTDKVTLRVTPNTTGLGAPTLFRVRFRLNANVRNRVNVL